MPLPEERREGRDRSPRRYWLFSGDRFFLARVASGGRPLLETTDGPAPLSRWRRTLATGGFKDGVDAVLPVPGVPDEFWIFAKDQYLRMAVSENGHRDTLEAGPRPIDDWSTAFEGLDLTAGIDGVMPTPDVDNAAWVFSGGLYVRTFLRRGPTPGGSAKEAPRSVSAWSHTFRRSRGFGRGIDAAIPLPSDDNEFWVFSGTRYMKIHVADDADKYADRRLMQPRPIAPA